ncbi:ABC transporter ATP-binding protein [cf. Phormidesmis sp. LEGE 11477]|uniref:ABC transporter ATP-binding protein n=1 Tax=cf. Phormidesmis sp. LEGE 11477 TaxID=1828680 RepID=UPI0018827310|nr:ABC transporter ATP-binding protein [cf. Phormidesmis sp. LEGE 11477]MBE9065020.1 ABC transporter ATP-binding protein [cf. Phormidesmis sp. LEGE 11477]
MSNSLLIKTDQLTKQFDDYAAVNSVNLEVRSGEVYGLIGPNGAGKTTLIRLLALAELPTTGDIFIDGRPLLKGEANPEIKRRLGFLPDDFPLYNDLSVQNYLEYFGQLYYLRPKDLQQRITEVLALVDLESKRLSLVSSLSRGMKQRLSLARTVIHQPKLLLLDEPVSGLDPLARIEYCKTIKRLQQEGMTIFISSHILSDLEDFCTSIGIMERGRLVESGRLQSLYQQNVQQLLIGVLDPSTLLDGYAPIEIYLQEHPLVSTYRRMPDTGKFLASFVGGDTDAAELLRVLVQEGVQINEFSYVKETLEDIFLKLGHRQTA